MANSKNRYVFDASLEGFINIAEPQGKFNNCAFSFTLPADVLAQAEKDREELLKWAKTKVEGRVNVNMAKWDEEGLVKYSFDGDTSRPRPIFVDASGDVVGLDVLKSVRRGTKVRLIVQQTPYTKPSVGTTLKVLGVQIIELATGNGAVDSGSLSAEDVAGIFGTVEGFKASDPAVREAVAPANATDSYDF